MICKACGSPCPSSLIVFKIENLKSILSVPEIINTNAPGVFVCTACCSCFKPEQRDA